MHNYSAEDAAVASTALNGGGTRIEWAAVTFALLGDKVCIRLKKVFAQKPAGVAGWSMGSPESEDSKPLAPKILLSLLYLESQSGSVGSGLAD